MKEYKKEEECPIAILNVEKIVERQIWELFLLRLNIHDVEVVKDPSMEHCSR